MSKTIKNILSLGSATLISAILSFVLGIITRNILGPEKFGYWLSVSIIFTFTPLIQLGVLNAMNREVPFYKARQNTEKIKEIKNYTLSFIFTLPLLCVILMLLLGIIISFFSIDIEYKIGVIFSSIIAFLLFLSLYVEMYYKSEQNFYFASKLITVKSVMQSILTVILVYVYGYIGLYIGMILALIIQIFTGRTAFNEFVFKFDIKKYKELIRIGLPIMLVGMIWSILVASDRIIITFVMNPIDLGNYGVGMLIFNSMMMLPQVIGQVLYPRIVEEVSVGKFNTIYKNFWKVNLLIALGMVPIVTLIYIFLPWFVTFFLPSYSDGISTGQILLLGVYPLALIGYAANYFNATHNQTLYMIIQLITIFINISLSLLFLFLKFDITSVAWGTSISYLFYFILMNSYFLIKIRKRLDKKEGEQN